jgi:hypothetical protein
VVSATGDDLKGDDTICGVQGVEWNNPMYGTQEVCLTLTEEPICGLGDAGIEMNSTLWDSIIATESYPPDAGAAGANYILRLKKR